MLSDEDVVSNVYAGRTGNVLDQPNIFGDECDEINLENEDTPPSKLRLNTYTTKETENAHPESINSIEDHEQYVLFF